MQAGFAGPLGLAGFDADVEQIDAAVFQAGFTDQEVLDGGSTGLCQLAQ